MLTHISTTHLKKIIVLYIAQIKTYRSLFTVCFYETHFFLLIVCELREKSNNVYFGDYSEHASNALRYEIILFNFTDITMILFITNNVSI